MSISSWRILLATSTTRWSRALVEAAVAEAARADADGRTVELDVLYVIEQHDLDRVYKAVGGSGFLGTQPQQEITSLLYQEHLRVATRRIEEARRAVEERGFATRQRECVGEYGAEVRRAAQEGAYDVVVMQRSSEAFLARFFFGSESDRVARWAKAEGIETLFVDAR